MICITIDKLADKARNNEWELTNDEAIDVFILIPEGCSRMNDLDGKILLVKGLGEFRIKNV